MTALQIALLVCGVVILWLSAIALIVVWVMGMSRNTALDEQVFRRTVERAGTDSSTAPDRTSA